MKRIFQFISAVSIVFIAASIAQAQQPVARVHDECQHHSEKADASSKAHKSDHHLSEVNRRGDEAMGFSHKKTAHHFGLTGDGGFVDVSANDANDKESRSQIRQHLAQIEKLFAEGDFTMPMHTHGKVPPGVTAMTKLKAEITYRYEETERGGRVRISTTNGEALAAIHEFLRFQIEDHKTGDSLEVQK